MSSTRRAWTLFGAGVALALVAATATWLWRKHAIVSRVEVALPPTPALVSHPDLLRERLVGAEEKAKSPGSTLAGIAELGRLYHANGFNREAEACWRFLHHEQPSEARWSYYLADLRRAQSDYAEMTALLEETLARAPDYAPARLQLANLQFKSGALEPAGRNYRLCLEARPHDPYARLGLARIALDAGQTAEAKSLLELLLGDAPHFSSGHNLYAELLAAAGDEAGADRHRWLGRETLRYREPEDPWLQELQAWCYDYDRLNVLGTIELQSEEHDRAKACFERAIEVDPARPDAYELLGSLYLKRGDAAHARDLLEQALPRLHDRSSPRIFITLGLAYRELKQPAEAARIARLGIEQLGPQAELLDALGLALADTGQHKQAVETWQSALAKNPGDAAVNYNLAKSLLALRHLDEALAALDRSLTLQPTYLPTLLLRGEIELQANHLDAAANYLQPAFESHPEDAQARRLLSEWHLRAGAAAEAKSDSATAEQHYRDGLGVDEKHPELLVRLGLFYLMRGRASDAIAPLASFNALQPDSAPGCLFLGQAYLATNQLDQARDLLTRGAQLADRTGNTRVARECRQLLGNL